ncbi:inositol 3-kinase [Neltuma alba]|uniref:inositol 3-kinase n=1 Tax=Neltuma alba TaxID=207710 RepID=UPI0010A502D5|nr:inositol 3-kinase [Prosopis alba]
MVRDTKAPQNSNLWGLIVGNYCHDVLIRDGRVVGETLGGAACFISAVLDALSVSFRLVSKVGSDFAYSTKHGPISVPNVKTTLFHAYFDSEVDAAGHQDRVLRRVCACDPIHPSDLPVAAAFQFGMAVGVGGEILPETLERLLDVCNIVFVDVQALIRTFDVRDGTVKLVGLNDSGFFHLLPRIGFLKASSDEAFFFDLDEVRQLCCVVVTYGKNGCKIYWKDGEIEIAPFTANQVDPTGAGDSFLGGFAAGLVQGLAVPDAALLGNFFGSLTVAQVGLPKLDTRSFQMVKDEMHRRMLDFPYPEKNEDGLTLRKPFDHQQFYASLDAARSLLLC